MTSIPCARLVTYVVATFNEESNILAFLDSIPANIAQNSIFHFQDCQSYDSTFRLIESAAKSYSHLDIRLYSEFDTGIYDAWNKAIDVLQNFGVCNKRNSLVLAAIRAFISFY